MLRGEITCPESHGWQISEPGPLGKKRRGCIQSGSIPSSLDILCDFSVSAMILIYRQGTRLRQRRCAQGPVLSALSEASMPLWGPLGRYGHQPFLGRANEPGAHRLGSKGGQAIQVWRQVSLTSSVMSLCPEGSVVSPWVLALSP